MQQNRRESGQSIIIIVFIVLVILALLALVVDVGNAYAQRRVVQNAVDAAAMACATKLAQQGPLMPEGYRDPEVTDTEVETAMRDYAEVNGLDRNNVQGVYVDSTGADIAIVGNFGRSPVPVNAMGVRVDGDLTFATYFAHLLGVDEITVNAPSAAYVLTGPCSGDELFPIALIDSTFCEPGETPPCAPTVGTGDPADEYTVWDKDDKTIPGNFGWVYWKDGNGVVRGTEPPNQNSNTTNLSANIEDTSRSGHWRIGDEVNGNTGVSLNPVLDELAPYISGSDPPDVVIPIYDTATGTGNNALYHITGFGAFQLTCAYNSKNQKVERYTGACAGCNGISKCIRGYFVRMVEEPFEDGCMDTGLTAPSYRMPTQP